MGVGVWRHPPPPIFLFLARSHMFSCNFEVSFTSIFTVEYYDHKTCIQVRGVRAPSPAPVFIMI